MRNVAPKGFAEFRSSDLLDALNGKRDFASELKIYAMLAPTGQHEEEDASKAGEVFLAVLRDLVNAWLKSGVRAGGVEIPKDRNISAKKPFDSLQQWVFRNPPLAVLTNSGEMKMQVRPANLKAWAGMVNAAFDEARTLFLLLMTSQAKYALFKCSHPGCGVYYILEKPRGQYKQGAMCPEHRRQQGTRTQRKRDHAEALQVAREALAMWPKLSASTRSKHKDEKHFIASKLKRFGVGAKWVSRNLTEITNGEVSTNA
jgi:hypothetical protein